MCKAILERPPVDRRGLTVATDRPDEAEVRFIVPKPHYQGEGTQRTFFAHPSGSYPNDSEETPVLSQAVLDWTARGTEKCGLIAFELFTDANGEPIRSMRCEWNAESWTWGKWYTGGIGS